MNPIRAVIVDDEELAREGLKTLIKDYCPYVTIVGMADGIAQGYEMIKEHNPNLVFMDIEMPHGSGFDLLDSLGSRKFKLIFTTAYTNYAIKAVKEHADDYLLKPIDPDELQAAIKKVSASDDLSTDKLGRLVLNTQEKIYFVEPHDIIRCQSESNYTTIKIQGRQSLTISQTLKQIEERLPESDFIRVHQSHLINKNFVEEFTKANNTLLMKDGDKVEVASRKKNEVISKLMG